jgi:hypothetical protein
MLCRVARCVKVRPAVVIRLLALSAAGSVRLGGLPFEGGSDVTGCDTARLWARTGITAAWLCMLLLCVSVRVCALRAHCFRREY